MAPFSGQYSDLEPAFSPDGTRLFFASNRPLDAQGVPKDYDIWFVEMTDTGWSDPQNIGEPVNTSGNEYYPSVSAEGSLYFTARHPGSLGGEDIFRSRLVNGSYGPSENLGPAINSDRDEFNACVSPSEDLLLFSSFGRQDQVGGGDLYVSFWTDEGSWTPARILGTPINTPSLDFCPSISPDGRYLFFSSRTTSRSPHWESRRSFAELESFLNAPLNGSGDVFWVELSVLDRYR
jgi:Tol biopolymer transport system component